MGKECKGMEFLPNSVGAIGLLLAKHIGTNPNFATTYQNEFQMVKEI